MQQQSEMPADTTIVNNKAQKDTTTGTCHTHGENAYKTPAYIFWKTPYPFDLAVSGNILMT